MNSKLPISVAVVCQDEEDRIRGALESVGFADEIVVVDSGSRDKTLEIVREFTDRVYEREWKGWRDQKGWAAAQCKNEWVLTLDADEVVSEELAASIRRAFEEGDPREQGFLMARRTWYQGRWIRHSGWYPDRKLRLYRKQAAHFGGEDPHEVIEVPEPTRVLEGDLLHYTYRDFPHHAAQLTRYAMVNARAKFERGERANLIDLTLRPPFAVLKAYVLKAGFLDGRPGLLIGAMMGYYTFLKYARLWELGREGR